MELALIWVRRVALHTSFAGFTLDFAHSLFGNAMIFATTWQHCHEVAVPYAAFGATLVVYLDGYRERIKGKGERKASPTLSATVTE